MSFSPMTSASATPLGPSPTSMSVAPNFSRMSNTGTPAAIKAALWNIACMVTPTSPNGTTDGEWLCTTDMISGRAL